jgi:hypothetical protein
MHKADAACVAWQYHVLTHVLTLVLRMVIAQGAGLSRLFAA